MFHHLAMSVTYQCLVKLLGCGMDCGCFFLSIDMAFYGGFTIFGVVSRFCMLAILYISVIGGLLKCTVNLCVSFGTC